MKKYRDYGEYLEDANEQQALAAMLEHIEQVINSYLGFTLRRQTYQFKTTAINSMDCAFWRYFSVKGHYKSIRLKRRYRMIHV